MLPGIKSGLEFQMKYDAENSSAQCQACLRHQCIIKLKKRRNGGRVIIAGQCKILCGNRDFNVEDLAERTANKSKYLCGKLCGGNSFIPGYNSDDEQCGYHVSFVYSNYIFNSYARNPQRRETCASKGLSEKGYALVVRSLD